MTQHSDISGSLTILDLLEKKEPAGHAAVVDKALEDMSALRRSMNALMATGLTPEDMATARAVAEGALAGEEILNKLRA